MSVAAAIRPGEPADDWILRRAGELASATGRPCYAIAIVDGSRDEDSLRDQLDRIAALGATPVIGEGADVPRSLADVARGFGIRTLLLGHGSRRVFRRSVAEALLRIAPPFDVVVLRER